MKILSPRSFFSAIEPKISTDKPGYRRELKFRLPDDRYLET